MQLELKNLKMGFSNQTLCVLIQTTILLENKVDHHDFLGYVPLSPHSMLEFQIKMQCYGDTNSPTLERVRMLSCLVYFAVDYILIL